MKMKGLKKLLVSLGLCAVLTVGMSTAAFADSTEAIPHRRKTVFRKYLYFPLKRLTMPPM